MAYPTPTNLSMSNLTKQFIPLLFISIIVISCTDSSSDKVSEKLSTDLKIDSLLAVMTLEEKVGQTNLYNGTWDFTGPVPKDDNAQEKAENIKKGKVGAMLNVLTVDAVREAQEMAVNESRLGIPMLFGYDVVHGYKTMLPIPLAQASSWDQEVAIAGNRLAAKEAASSGLSWAFAPMIDVSRDSRWGRIMEGGGEDPYLTSIMAKGWVKGFQGDNLSDRYSIAACAKHFAAYGFAEAGREYNTTDISINTLHNIALPPFQAAIEAGVASVMNGFNDLNGVPVTADSYLQRDLLKGDWGFEGFVVSDYNSTIELVEHGYSKDLKQAAADAFNAGSDMEMDSRSYERNLKLVVEEGLVSEAYLDDAVRRILKIKFDLGLFDNPYKYCDAIAEQENILTEENLAVARDAARKSMVLLKNEGELLPLDKKQTVAVIGQLANSKDIPLGSWRAKAIPNSAVSVLEGIQNTSEGRVSFAQGYTLTEGDRVFIYELNFAKPTKSGFAEARRIAAAADVVVMAMGEDCFQSGEGRSQVDITLKGNQLDLLIEVLKVNKKVVVVLMNGRPVAIPELMEAAPAVLETWYGGSEAGNAIADILYGDFNPSGKLPVSFPYYTGQEPLYYNKKSSGRPERNDYDAEMVFWSHYTDSPNEALLPFGHGLSYTTFEYQNLEVAKSSDGISISVEVTNTGNVAGTEVAQLYIRDITASITRPVKELKGFEKIAIEEGQTAKVSFNLSRDELSFYNNQGEKVFEPGEFEVFVGTSSVDVLSKKITLE